MNVRPVGTRPVGFARAIAHNPAIAGRPVARAPIGRRIGSYDYLPGLGVIEYVDKPGTNIPTVVETVYNDDTSILTTFTNAQGGDIVDAYYDYDLGRYVTKAEADAEALRYGYNPNAPTAWNQPTVMGSGTAPAAVYVNPVVTTVAPKPAVQPSTGVTLPGGIKIPAVTNPFASVMPKFDMKWLYIGLGVAAVAGVGVGVVLLKKKKA